MKVQLIERHINGQTSWDVKLLLNGASQSITDDYGFSEYLTALAAYQGALNPKPRVENIVLMEGEVNERVEVHQASR